MKNWIAIASAEHARRGRDTRQGSHDGGFLQVCHGKLAAVRRILPGDRITYYAPTVTMGGKDRCQKFISIGRVQDGAPYPFDMGGGFVPYRRDVAYVAAQETPIAPLLERFEFVDDRQHWGSKFRFGLFPVSDHDMRLIAQAMAADPVALGWH